MLLRICLLYSTIPEGLNNFRNHSRCLMKSFRFSRTYSAHGEARTLRLPKARGPNSVAPWYQPMTLPARSNCPCTGWIVGYDASTSCFCTRDVSDLVTTNLISNPGNHFVQNLAQARLPAEAQQPLGLGDVW